MTTRKLPDETDWRPGWRPSNGTEGDIFRRNWCDQCAHDHAVHLDIDNAGFPDHPEGVCAIFTESLVPKDRTERAGPDEWEDRIVHSDQSRIGWTIESRCTQFEKCIGCVTFKEEQRRKIWPVESDDSWKPKTVSVVEGQEVLFA